MIRLLPVQYGIFLWKSPKLIHCLVGCPFRPKYPSEHEMVMLSSLEYVSLSGVTFIVGLCPAFGTEHVIAKQQRKIYMKQEAHGPHRSHEKPVQINKQI